MIELARALAETDVPGVRLLLGRANGAGSGGSIAVTVNGATVTLPHLRSYTPQTLNDVVLIVRSPDGGGWVLGALNAAQIAPPVTPGPPDAGQTIKTGSTPFGPTSTGSYRAGWRGDTATLFQGDYTGRGRNYGAAYFGDGPDSLTGTCTGLTVSVTRDSGGVVGAQAPTFRLLADKARPGGAPGMKASTGGPGLAVGQSADVALPVSWGQELMNGTAGGIGIGVDADTPYIGLLVRTIRLDWTTATLPT